MCNYCGTKHHRKIYENHHGSIPIDNFGRTYDIHHLDGNHSNNDPINLIALSIQEHYDIHHKQDNFGACIALAKRMKLSPEERSALASKQQLERSKNGTHHFLGGSVARTVVKKRIESGEFQRMNKETQLKKVEKGTHPFLKKNRTWAGATTWAGKTGKEHPKYDHTIYHLQNIEAGAIVNGTRKELIKELGLTDNHLSRLIHKRNKLQKGWRLFNDPEDSAD